MKSILNYFLFQILGLRRPELPRLVEQTQVRYGHKYQYYGVSFRAVRHTCHKLSCRDCQMPRCNRSLLVKHPEYEASHEHQCTDCSRCDINRLHWPCRCCNFPDGVNQGHFELVDKSELTDVQRRIYDEEDDLSSEFG